LFGGRGGVFIFAKNKFDVILAIKKF